MGTTVGSGSSKLKAAIKDRFEKATKEIAGQQEQAKQEAVLDARLDHTVGPGSGPQDYVLKMMVETNQELIRHSSTGPYGDYFFYCLGKDSDEKIAHLNVIKALVRHNFVISADRDEHVSQTIPPTRLTLTASGREWGQRIMVRDAGGPPKLYRAAAYAQDETELGSGFGGTKEEALAEAMDKARKRIAKNARQKWQVTRTSVDDWSGPVKL